MKLPRTLLVYSLRHVPMRRERFPTEQISTKDFELWAAVIRSDQLPQEHVPKLLRYEPKFARWYSRRFLSQRGTNGQQARATAEIS